MAKTLGEMTPEERAAAIKRAALKFQAELRDTEQIFRILEEDDEDDYMEPSPKAFCDAYEVHEPHNYRAVNHNHYNCPGLSAEDLAAIDERANHLCEHGMSADLCAGPNHYPADDRY